MSGFLYRWLCWMFSFMRACAFSISSVRHVGTWRIMVTLLSTSQRPMGDEVLPSKMQYGLSVLKKAAELAGRCAVSERGTREVRCGHVEGRRPSLRMEPIPYRALGT
jgi:hypothetical protein